VSTVNDGSCQISDELPARCFKSRMDKAIFNDGAGRAGD
jgi:hypothetical protein